jgi:hypothetical protein
VHIAMQITNRSARPLLVELAAARAQIGDLPW